MDGLHTIGDILTKISTNYVINLHVALLFTCLFYGFIICVIIIIWMFMVISYVCFMSDMLKPQKGSEAVEGLLSREMAHFLGWDEHVENEGL